MSVGKYKRKLFKIFFIMSTIFMLIFVCVTTFFITANQKNQYRNTLQLSVGALQNVSQLSMTIIGNIMQNIESNSAFENWALSKTESEYYFNSVIAYNQLKNVTTSLSLVDFDIAATIYDENSFFITHFGTISKDTYFSGETLLTTEQVDNLLYYFHEHHDPLLLPAYENEVLKEIYYIKKVNYKQKDILYFIKIPYRTLFGEEQNLILYDQKTIVYSSAEKKQKKIFDEVSQTLQVSNGYFANNFFRAQGKNVLITRLDDLDWTIAYIYDDIGLNLTHVIKFIVPVFLLLLFLAMLFSVFITDRLYRPIGEVIKEVLPRDEKKHVIDEFQILKQNTKIAKQLNVQLQAVLSEKDALNLQCFYQDLLFGIGDRGKIKIKDDYKRDAKNYCVALIEIKDNIHLQGKTFITEKNIYSAAQKYDNLHYVNISQFLCAVIIEINSLEEAKDIVLEITQCIDECFSLKISISEIRKGLSNVHNCFEEATKILEYKYLFGHSKILTMQQVAKLDTTTFFYPMVKENRLIQCILEGKAEAVQVFDELIKENIRHRNLAPDVLKSFVFALIGTLNRVFQELKISSADLLGREISFIELYNSWNDSNIIFNLRSIMTDIAEAVNEKNSNKADELLAEMLNYIHDCYSDDIMLSDLASKFNVSAKYCSALFKKLNDDNFKNVLNKYRIQRAKEHLEQNPDIKIYDLSKMVGFNSSNSFIRVFSKYIGMTPKAFSEKVIKL